LPTSFNAAVREVFHDIGRQSVISNNVERIDHIEYFVAKLAKWFDGVKYAEVVEEEERKNYWCAISGLALYGYKEVTGLTTQKVKLDGIHTMIKKQADYGPHNILRFGERGVVVRIYDKVARLKNLTTTGREPNNESIADTWLDIMNYAVIAVMLINRVFELPLDWDEVDKLKA